MREKEVSLEDLKKFKNKRVVFGFCRPDGSLFFAGYASDLERMVELHLRSNHKGNRPTAPGKEFLETKGAYAAILKAEENDKSQAQERRLKEYRDAARASI